MAASVVAALAAGLLVLVWATVTGPVRIMSPSGRTRNPPASQQPSSGETGSVGARDPIDQVREARRQIDLSWLGELLIWAIFLTFLAGVAWLLVHLWRNRWHPPARPEDVEFDVLPQVEAVGEAITADAAAQLAAMAEGSARNAIVRCWLRLEEVIAQAGLPRHTWETSAEFTVRILKRLDLDPRAIGELSRLYGEARFSEHELDETARTAARAALEQLHAELQADVYEPDRPGRTPGASGRTRGAER